MPKPSTTNGDTESTDSEAGTDNDVKSSESDVGESFVDWISRATHMAEDVAAKLHVTDWVSEQRKRKWQLAGHTARRNDGRWSTQMVFWQPHGIRNVGHPVK
eukprot:5058766-Karenia_brevis.AAC.1